MLKLCRDASVGGGGFQRQQQLEERDAVSGAAFSDTLFAKFIAEQAVKIAEGGRISCSDPRWPRIASLPQLQRRDRGNYGHAGRGGALVHARCFEWHVHIMAGAPVGQFRLRAVHVDDQRPVRHCCRDRC